WSRAAVQSQRRELPPTLVLTSPKTGDHATLELQHSQGNRRPRPPIPSRPDYRSHREREPGHHLPPGSGPSCCAVGARPPAEAARRGLSVHDPSLSAQCEAQTWRLRKLGAFTVVVSPPSPDLPASEQAEAARCPDRRGRYTPGADPSRALASRTG